MERNALGRRSRAGRGRIGRCAVGGGEALNVQAAKGSDGFVHAFGAGLQEVEATHNGMNRPAAGEVLDVFKGVHHARMGATEPDL